MIIIECPSCSKEFQVNISKAIDEHGEVFICPKCKKAFRYAVR